MFVHFLIIFFELFECIVFSERLSHINRLNFIHDILDDLEHHDIITKKELEKLFLEYYVDEEVTIIDFYEKQ